MKDKKISDLSSSTTTMSNTNKRRMIRKSGVEDIVISRLRDYLLYSRLRSLIPPHQPFSPVKGDEGEAQEAIEVEMELNEIPQRDSDEENDNALPSSSSIRNGKTMRKRKEEYYYKDEDDSICHTILVFESEDENEEDMTSSSTKQFVPTIQIKKMDSTIIINTTVLKDVALTSNLFKVLEAEKLDIEFENHYRTENEVSHTIQMKVRPDYNIGELEMKLQKWGAGELL